LCFCRLEQTTVNFRNSNLTFGEIVGLFDENEVMFSPLFVEHANAIETGDVKFKLILYFYLDIIIK